MGAPRIAFYAVNGLGLGHVTRLLAIARSIRRLRPDCEMLFLTSSEADDVIYREGFAAVKVPSKSIREQCGLKISSFVKTVQSVTWNTISGFDPDVLVVDTFPTGSLEELLPVLRWRQRNVFVYREQRADSFQSDLLAAALPLYDIIVVPHETLAAVGPLPQAGKAIAVGPILIRERNELKSRRAARRALGLPQEGELIYATFGGGGDPNALRALQLAAAALRERGDVQLIAGVGPLLRDGPEHVAGVHLLRGRFPMLDVLPAFDAAIASAGYNSLHELLFAGVPTAAVPFGRVLDDQEQRAQALADQGGCLVCTPLTRDSIERAIAQLLDRGLRQRLASRGPQLIARNGASAAGRAILELL